MTKFKTFLKNFIKDESGQGTAEYVLLLVIVVALVMVFKKQITDTISKKTDEVTGSIMDLKSQ